MPGGENNTEAGKLGVQSPPGYMASWVGREWEIRLEELVGASIEKILY